MSSDWKQGIALDEYERFVRFADPHQAAQVLFAGMTERANLANGSSGGYTETGSGYENYGRLPLSLRFPGEVGGWYRWHPEKRLSPMAFAMSRFTSLVQNHRWIMPQDVDSGATVRLWNDHMPELLTSIGLSDFADPARSTGFRIPEFYPTNQAKVFTGIASGISLLTHAVSVGYFKLEDANVWYESSYAYGDGETPFHVIDQETYSQSLLLYYRTEHFSAYRGYSGNDNELSLCIEKPLSLTLQNSGGCILHFSAVFSGNFGTMTVDHSAGQSSPWEYSALGTVTMRETISAGGSMTLPVSGYYTSGKTFASLLPDSARRSVSGCATASTGGWRPHGGFVYSGFSGRTSMCEAFEAVEIGGECRFFNTES